MDSTTENLPLASLKKQEKLREFREYLADKGVVLSIVKRNLNIVLISLRNSEKFPENPANFIQDYFGHYRDPMWDEVEFMKSEIQSLNSSIEEKIKEIVYLQQEISKNKRISHVKETFTMLGPDNNGFISTKILVQKLSGQPRFEVDYKLNLQNFVSFVIEHLIVGDNEEEKQNNWNLFYLPFRDLCTAADDGKPKPPPFVGRVEDSTYQKILDKIRSFTPR